jgi:hypothetical protein
MRMQKKIHGSCLCGGVKFVITGPLLRPLNCHCSMCRKAHSAAFRSRAGVARADFHYVSGEDLVHRYESSPGTWRCFCGRCGSRLQSEFADPAEPLGVPLGLLDDDPEIAPRMHIHVSSKAPWHQITDSLPQHQEMPPSPLKK